MRKGKDLTFGDFDKLVDKAFRNVAQREARSLRRGTETWTNKPSFRMEKTSTGYRIVTDSSIWKFVNYGTPKHTIRARNAKTLKYQKNFTPKTRPNFVGSKQGGKSGDFIFPSVVEHPGVKARRFDLKNLEKLEDRIIDELDKVLKDL